MVTIKKYLQITLYLFLMAVLSSCAAQKTTGQEEELAPIKTIVVLPVETSIPTEAQDNNLATKQLIEGQLALNSILDQYFANNDKVRVLTEGQRDTMEKNFTRCRTTDAVTICNTYNADAVLICTLHQYQEREGTEYSVVKPASLAFDLKLVMAQTGKTLWSASYSETQQHMLTDIFKFMEKAKRGFKWITAKQLAKEGLEQKLDKCRYFNQ